MRPDDDRLVVHTNAKNLGFVKSVNIGLEIARKDGRHALLVNSDTITFPGTLRELVEVSTADPQIGFVSPRSNNASICSLPHFRWRQAAVAGGGFDANWNASAGLCRPSTSARPASAFICSSHTRFLMNHGGLREDFGVGYEEENDLVMRASKVGTRAVIANHAFAYHAGAASFSTDRARSRFTSDGEP